MKVDEKRTIERRKLFLPQDKANVELRVSGEGENEKRTIEGMGAVFYDGTEHTEYIIKYSDWTLRERILPGAFDDVLNDDVRGLFNHDPNMLLGRLPAGTLSLRITERGLEYVIDVPDTTVGNDVAENLRLKNLTGSSFAFRVAEDGQKWNHTDTESVREITKFSEMYDVGPVTYPAYTATEASLRDGESVRQEFIHDRENRLKEKMSIMDKRIRVMEIESGIIN